MNGIGLVVVVALSQCKTKTRRRTRNDEEQWWWLWFCCPPPFFFFFSSSFSFLVMMVMMARSRARKQQRQRHPNAIDTTLPRRNFFFFSQATMRQWGIHKCKHPWKGSEIPSDWQVMVQGGRNEWRAKKMTAVRGQTTLTSTLIDSMPLGNQNHTTPCWRTKTK